MGSADETWVPDLNGEVDSGRACEAFAVTDVYVRNNAKLDGDTARLKKFLPPSDSDGYH